MVFGVHRTQVYLHQRLIKELLLFFFADADQKESFGSTILHENQTSQICILVYYIDYMS